MRNKYSQFSDPNDFVSCPGDKFHVLYSPIIKADGSIELVESGKDDIQEFIESFKDQTDMTYILQRMAAGDQSVLNQSMPLYGDFTDMPKTYAESLQLVIDKERQFMELPLDVRNKFDNDFRKWFAQSGSEEWYEKMSPVIPNFENERTESSEDSQEVKE